MPEYRARVGITSRPWMRGHDVAAPASALIDSPGRLWQGQCHDRIIEVWSAPGST